VFDSVPAYGLAPGVRLRLARDGNVLLVPEGIVALSETAAAILGLVDGSLDEDAIAKHLAERFDAPVDELRRDVAELLTSLRERGFLSDAPRSAPLPRP
jgi:pyrroloquinoline quinone biosynthesis protein D